MHSYTVKVRINGKLYKYATMAVSWYEAWCEAADEFGVKAVRLIKPA